MRQPESSLPTFLTTDQAAGILNMTRRALTGLIAKKQGPPVYKIGPRFRIRKDELFEWLSAKRHP